jgi:hypothetical protein
LSQLRWQSCVASRSTRSGSGEISAVNAASFQAAELSSDWIGCATHAGAIDILNKFALATLENLARILQARTIV